MRLLSALPEILVTYKWLWVVIGIILAQLTAFFIALAIIKRNKKFIIEGLPEEDEQTPQDEIEQSEEAPIDAEDAKIDEQQTVEEPDTGKSRARKRPMILS